MFHCNTSYNNTTTLTIKVSFNIRHHAIMIRNMTVLPRDVFGNPIKSLWWNFFAKIVNKF